MMIKIIFYTYILIWCDYLSAVEYVYPVGADNRFIYLIKQTDQKKLELYKKGIGDEEFKRETYSFNQDMLYHYSVTNFQLLPNNKGYSFVDNGRLRVKFHTKSSPFSVDFLYPLYDLNSIMWWNETHGIICAKYKAHFGLFNFSIDGRVKPIIWTGLADFYCPQKIGNNIFCIKRCLSKGLTEIIKFDYMNSKHLLTPWNTLSFDDQVEVLMRKEHAHIKSASPEAECIVQIDNALCLSMLKSNFGLYIACSDETCSSVNFSCYCMINKGGGWQDNRLFNFNIPKCLLLESYQHVIEKRRLILPVIHKQKIYFIDSCGKENSLGVFSYNLSTGKINREQMKEGIWYFGCQYLKKKLYFGGSAKTYCV